MIADRYENSAQNVNNWTTKQTKDSFIRYKIKNADAWKVVSNMQPKQTRWSQDWVDVLVEWLKKQYMSVGIMLENGMYDCNENNVHLIKKYFKM